MYKTLVLIKKEKQGYGARFTVFIDCKNNNLMNLDYFRKFVTKNPQEKQKNKNHHHQHKQQPISGVDKQKRNSHRLFSPHIAIQRVRCHRGQHTSRIFIMIVTM